MKREINVDLGPVDILVNNAGLMPVKPFRGIDTDGVRRVMDVNVLAHFWVNFDFSGSNSIVRHINSRESEYVQHADFRCSETSEEKKSTLIEPVSMSRL